MILQEFSTPAFIQDFPAGSPEANEMANRWNINIDGWIQQAMPGAPSYFYNPLQTDIPSGTLAVAVTWVAFPGRLDQYYSQNPPVAPPNPYNLPSPQVYSLADTGFTDSTQATSFQPIPATLCPEADWTGTLKTFGPYGPRGWLDEYCEWAAARDGNGNLIRIDFACENPEYWNTVWKISAERVRELYEETLNAGAPAAQMVSVQLSDLQLFDQNGNPVMDPDTGQPAYNPLNKWNSGPVSVRTGSPSSFTGGAMHLTSTPNTLQTELGLAGAATVQYQPPSGTGNSDPQALICCGNYGQEYRHSDPRIGQSVNMVVGGQALGKPQLACLADPVGLYIQYPQSPGAFAFGPNIVPGTTVPSNAQATDILQIVRGSLNVTDPVTGQPFPGNMILHVACQIPASWLAMTPTLTLADMVIGGQPLLWAGQIANQFNIGLFARPLLATSNPPNAPCASTVPTPGQPLQCMHLAMWNGYYPINEPCPTGAAMSLASNTTFIAPRLPSPSQLVQLALTCNNPGNGNLTVQILDAAGQNPDPNIQVIVVAAAPVTYAVPGNSYPGDYTVLYLDVGIGAGLPAGLRGIQITLDGQPLSLPAAVYLT